MRPKQGRGRAEACLEGKVGNGHVHSHCTQAGNDLLKTIANLAPQAIVLLRVAQRTRPGFPQKTPRFPTKYSTTQFTRAYPSAALEFL